MACEKLIYQGPSPDEVTLVEFARERGFSFIMSNDSVARIKVRQGTKDVKSRPSDDLSQLTHINKVSL